jgi:hypothetical protein
MTEEEFANQYFESQMGINVDEYMEQVIEEMSPLETYFNAAVEKRLEHLNYICESCNIKPVERFYRYDDFNDLNFTNNEKY